MTSLSVVDVSFGSAAQRGPAEELSPDYYILYTCNNRPEVWLVRDERIKKGKEESSCEIN